MKVNVRIVPPEYEAKWKKDHDRVIRNYFYEAQGIISERLRLATILVLDDCFCDRFGDTLEERKEHYARFANCLYNMISDYKRDCYDWKGQWDDPHAIGNAMREELKERGIEVNFK